MGITVKRTKTDNIWLFDYVSLSGLSGDQDRVIFLSERDINIIYQGLKDIDRFITRIFVDVTGNMYTSVDNEQFEIFKQWQADLFNHLGDWRVTNQILTRIAEAIEELDTMSGCCGGIEGVNGGSAGAGMEPAPPSTTTDTTEDREGSPPSGYETWEEWDAEKCNWATYIVNQMKQDVVTMGAIDVGSYGATALAAVLLPLLVTPVGWVVILEICVIMIAATFTIGFYLWVADHIEAYKDEYICSLLNGNSVADAIANFTSAVGTQVAADPTFNALTGYWARSILGSLATIDSINRMFEPQAFTPPTADCSACSGDILAYGDSLPCSPGADNETGHLLEGIEVTFTSCEANFFGDTHSGMSIVSNPPESTINRKFTLVSASGLSSYYVQPYDEGSPIAGLTLSSASLPGTEIEASQIVIVTPGAGVTTEFTVTIKAEEIV